MKKFMQSKGAAWAAFILVLVYMVVTFRMRADLCSKMDIEGGAGWWMYIDMFFIFMSAFLNLLVCYLRNLNAYVARKLNTWSLVFGLLFVAALIGEYVALYICF
ncbi:MAG: hypothetical protein K2H21_02990 [Muribaculaceae bacterium]|nr:hypothetical protein [Muribaculaceae bacterium]